MIELLSRHSPAARRCDPTFPGRSALFAQDVIRGCPGKSIELSDDMVGYFGSGTLLQDVGCVRCQKKSPQRSHAASVKPKARITSKEPALARRTVDRRVIRVPRNPPQAGILRRRW